MTIDVKAKYDQILENIAEEIDIPPDKYKKAVQRYSSVGKWLIDGEYDECQGEPRIYPQGSFRLGTVIRPIRNGKESDYDIDLVCELQKDKTRSEPREIKDDVGFRLKDHETYKKMLDQEGRRCWTLNYTEEDGIGFHIDVLPSIPEDDATKSRLIHAGINPALAGQSISITDTDKDGKGPCSWSASNPGGYADWFDSTKEPAFKRLVASHKQRLFESYREVFESIDEVPDQLVKTPLQKTIQILKRHRDMRFADTQAESDKPISMILTTLAAQFYDNEEDVSSALKNIVEKIYVHARLMDPGYRLEETLAKRRIITRTEDGKWYIPNPVNPYENFADRWHENDNRKAKAFFQWVSWVRSDLVDILAKNDIRKITESLKGSFGERPVDAVSARLSLSAAPAILISGRKEPPSIEIRNPSRPWGHHG